MCTVRKNNILSKKKLYAIILAIYFFCLFSLADNIKTKIDFHLIFKIYPLWMTQYSKKILILPIKIKGYKLFCLFDIFILKRILIA